MPKSIADTTQFTGFDSYLDMVARWKAENTGTFTAEETFQYRRPIMLVTTMAGTTAFSPGDWVVWSDQGDVGVVRATPPTLRDTLRKAAAKNLARPDWTKRRMPTITEPCRITGPHGCDRTAHQEGGG